MSNNSNSKAMQTMYREPLTAEEINLHKNNYENETPAVYIGEYSLYAQGSLFGMWCDLTTFNSYDELLEFGERLFAFLPDPELMFQDYECFCREWYSESHIDVDDIIAWYNLDDDEQDAFEAFIEYEGRGKTIEKFRDAYTGHFDSPEEFAEDLYYNTGMMEGVPDWVCDSIDWSSIWRNLRCAGDYWENKGYYFAS